MNKREYDSDPLQNKKLIEKIRKLLVIDFQCPLTTKILSAAELNILYPEDRKLRQKGGELLALKILDSFFSGRGKDYCFGISSPLKSWKSCSRLSTYLSWGQISLRTVVQTVESMRKKINSNTVDKDLWQKSLTALSSRLRWRSHFIQKFEMQVSMEYINQCRAFDGLRQTTNESYLAAFKAGMTGFPMVDACIRALQSTGWINFRMRAMLASFAAYNLWLDWRVYSSFLARSFLGEIQLFIIS